MEVENIIHNGIGLSWIIKNDFVLVVAVFDAHVVSLAVAVVVVVVFDALVVSLAVVVVVFDALVVSLAVDVPI